MSPSSKCQSAISVAGSVANGPSGESGTLPHQRHEPGANIGRPEPQQVIGIDRLAQTSQQRPSPGSVSPRRQNMADRRRAAAFFEKDISPK